MRWNSGNITLLSGQQKQAFYNVVHDFAARETTPLQITVRAATALTAQRELQATRDRKGVQSRQAEMTGPFQYSYVGSHLLSGCLLHEAIQRGSKNIVLKWR